MMVTLPASDFTMVMAALSAPIRKRLKVEAIEGSDSVMFGDGIAADVYTEVMRYIALFGLTQDHAVTLKGRELGLIAHSIFEQSGG